MAVKIELKRSAVPGKIPTVGQLDLGELAINTYDGTVYFKQDTGVTQSIVQLTTTAGSGSSVASASYATYAATAGTATYATAAGTANFATSASYSETASYASSGDGIYSGSFSGSFYGDGSGLTNLSASSIVGLNLSQIASGSATASISPNLGFIVNIGTTISGSLLVSGSSVITGSLAVTQNITGSNALFSGTITAQTLDVQIISSSIIYSSGSNVFGNNLSDTQQFTGSVTVTGSLAVNGSKVILTNQTSSMSVLSASYASTASYVLGLSLSSIATGSITASVDIDPAHLFLIKSGSTNYFNIASDSTVTSYSNLFVIKNFTTQQPVFTVNSEIMLVATHSSAPTPSNGGFWFTATDLYIGVEDSIAP